MTKVELDLISDVYMYLFLEKWTRDSAFYIFKRYSKANNEYLTSYDAVYKLTYRDSGNTMQFLFFRMQFSPPSKSWYQNTISFST